MSERTPAGPDASASPSVSSGAVGSPTGSGAPSARGGAPGSADEESVTGTGGSPTKRGPEELHDGHFFALVHSVDTSNHRVRLDVAEFIEGQDAADRAAAEDGAKATNGYYIRNRVKKVESVDVEDQADIRVVDAKTGRERQADFATLAKLFGSGGKYSAAKPGPFTVFAHRGEVEKIEEENLS